jgi:uncharacterized protein YjbJ (UPF0337 family)
MYLVLAEPLEASGRTVGSAFGSGKKFNFFFFLYLKIVPSRWNLLSVHPLPFCARRMIAGDPEREFTMGATADRIKGAANQAVGKGKQAVGRAAGSTRMEAEGAGQELKGKVQETTGKAKDAIKKAVDKA